MTDTDYAFYTQQLDAQNGKGGPPEVTPGSPQPGWYRTRSNNAVVIWKGNDGLFASKITRNGVESRYSDLDAIDALFSEVCRRAVKGSAFKRFINTRKWPEDIETAAERGIGDNSGAPPPLAHDGMRGQINDLLDLARGWLKSIGGAVKTKEQVDKAANYATAFATLEKKAAAEFKERKQPILDEGKRIDKAWKPVIEAAEDAKREFKKACEDYLVAAKRKAAEQERRDREDAAARGEFLQHRPSAAVAGTSGGRVGLRTYKEAVVTDWKALAQHFLSMEELPKAVQEGLLRAAEPIVLAGGTIPGIILKTEQRAA